MKYGELNLGQIEAVVNKLGGMKGIERLLSGETGIGLQEPKVWRKLAISPSSLDEFLKKLRYANVDMGGAKTEQILESLVPFSGVSGMADLVLVPVWELGMRRGAPLHEIYSRAAHLGLRLCPLYVAFQLSLSECKKTRSDHVGGYVSVEPAAHLGSRHIVFDIGCGDRGSWLYPVGDKEGDVWNAGNKFIFILGK